MSNRKEIKAGLVASFPIFIGYFPIAMAFGLLSKNASVSFGDTSFFSIAVFAGASQFMALDLMRLNVSTMNIIFATFLINLRHLMMSASLSLNLKNINKRYVPLIAFGITDETFSILSFNKEKLTLPFIFSLYIMSYGSWVLGTITGYLIGEILPMSLQVSLSIGLYAMFAGLLFPQIKKEKKVAYLSLISVLVYVLIFYTGIFQKGWDIVFGIIISSLLGIIIFKDDEFEEI